VTDRQLENELAGLTVSHNIMVTTCSPEVEVGDVGKSVPESDKPLTCAGDSAAESC
jgi:hypothetical protein